MEITIVNCTTKAQLLDIHIDFARVQSSCYHRALIAKCYAKVVDPGRDMTIVGDRRISIGLLYTTFSGGGGGGGGAES